MAGTLERAIVIAAKEHEGQLDKAGHKLPPQGLRTAACALSQILLRNFCSSSASFNRRASSRWACTCTANSSLDNKSHR